MSQDIPISKLELKGSSKIVSDFFEFGIHTILYQRGIYPVEDFKVVKKYGLNMVVSIDEEVNAYIRKIMGQLHKWIYSKKISKLIVAITSKETGEVVERWQFNIEDEEIDTDSYTLESNKSSLTETNSINSKPIEVIQKEIQAIIRQITASITFLPELSGPHTFNVLVYAKNNAKVPSEWCDSDDAKLVTGDSVENVKFKSFSTSNHKVSSLVSYKLSE